MVDSLALGKPIIVTKVSGMRDVMRDGQNGFVVPQHDPGALLAAIRCVMDSAAWARQLGAWGARDVRVFTIERVEATYQSCYRELLA